MRKFFILLLSLPTFAFADLNAVVYNITNDKVIEGSLNSSEVSIASISKLMTVYTVLSLDQDLDEKLAVKSNRTPNTILSKGMVLSRRELIDLALISSDNIAAITLAENFPGGHSNFVLMMNHYAKYLGMNNSGFVEPTGLSPMNYSTISDIVLLTKAVSVFDIVKDAASTKHQQWIDAKKNDPKKKKKKPIKEPVEKKKRAYNPTSNFFGRDGIITIKTGFTRAAGFCITMLVSANDQIYNITVLGAKTKQERQKIVENSLRHIYNT